MDKEKLHTWEFQLKGISRNMRCKLLQKRSTGKTTECSKHLWLITIEKNIFSELNRCIFQISVKYIDLISLKYIDLVIPKILFILVLCNFNFYFKTTWLPPTKLPPPPPTTIYLPHQNKNFWLPSGKVLPPPPNSGGACQNYASQQLLPAQTLSNFCIIYLTK